MQSGAVLDVITAILVTAGIGIVLTLAGCDGSSTTSAPQRPVPAADLTTLRALRRHLTLVKNSRTGPDGAGHDILMQHSRWTQEAIFDALQR